MLKRIKPSEVLKGMYVHSFEGGWLAHPFWRTHFLIDRDDDLTQIRACSATAVVIDLAKSRVSRTTKNSSELLALRQANVAQDKMSATRVVADSQQAVRKIFDGVLKGKSIRTVEVLSVVDRISSSLTHNKAMLTGILRLKTRHEYTYLHSVAVCALMINFARELGLDDKMVRMTGMAGLLHDVGKTTIDAAILNKPGKLTDAEFAEMRNHTVRGHALLLAGESVPAECLDVCLHHHEKIDGSGYPFGLAGDRISLAARMGAICDVYDAVTSIRPYKDPWSPHGALLAMDKWSGHFDVELLFQFMKSIGIFPVGMLLRLRSGRLAIVMDNGRRASRAKLSAFYAINNCALIEPCDVTLSDTFSGDQVTAREDPAVWGFNNWDSMSERLLAGKRALPRDQR